MTQPALPSAQRVRIKWDGSTWSDVTDYIRGQDGTSVRFGRMSPTGEVEPAEFTCTLWNIDGRFSFDNPAGAYWPNVKKGVAVDWQVTGGDGVARTEFTGYLQALDPDFVDDGQAGAVVRLTAADAFSNSSRVLNSTHLEITKYETTFNGKTLDAWPFSDSSDSVELVNLGTSTSGTPARVVVPTIDTTLSGVQSGSYAVSPIDSGVYLDGMVSLQPISEVGPVIVAERSVTTTGALRLWFRTTEVPVVNDLYLVDAYDANQVHVWSIRFSVIGADSVLRVFDADGNNLIGGGAPYLGLDGVRDGLWREVQFEDDGGGSATLRVSRPGFNAFYTYGLSLDISTAAYFVIGGRMVPVKAEGVQTRCCTVDVAGLLVTDDTSIEVFGHARHALPLYPNRSLTNRLGDYAHITFGVGGTITITGTDDPNVAIPSQRQTGIEAFREIARTVGGVCWVKPDGTVEFLTSDSLRSATPTLTVDVEADGVTAPTLSAAVDTTPSRVTVTSPAGDVLVVDGAETGQVVQDSLVTCSLSTTDAKYAGQLRLAKGGRTLRVASLKVNLATAQADLWSSAYALFPGARVRVSGLPSDVLGWTYQDYEVVGWNKTVQLSTEGGQDAEGQFLELDLEPAWTVAETGTARAAAGSGAMTATAGTISGTSTGTLVVTTVSGPTLSTDAGDYPVTFDWNGEYVTANNPPAGSSSPQTLTIDTRGVAPSVARTHGSGESFDVANRSKVGI